MPRAQLITQAEIEALPEDPQQRFIGVEAICRERLYDDESHEQEFSVIKEMRHRYLNTVLSAAKFLNIGRFSDVDVPRLVSFDNDQFTDFVQDVESYTVRVMLQAAEYNVQTSIVLQGSTRQRLQTLTAHIREQIPKLNLSPEKTDRLNAKINAFESELANPKLRILVVAMFTLGVAAAISDVAGAGSALRQLVSQVEETIGLAKDTQDADAAARLTAPAEPRRLESSPADFSRGPEFDDEIPF